MIVNLSSVRAQRAEEKRFLDKRGIRSSGGRGKLNPVKELSVAPGGNQTDCRVVLDGERVQNAMGRLGQAAQHMGPYGPWQGAWILFSA